jgi:hypothetical protein
MSNTIADHASAVTYASAGVTLTLWGLRLSDIAVIVSACATVGGFLLQLWVARHKVALMKRSDRWQAGDKVNGSKDVDP